MKKFIISLFLFSALFAFVTVRAEENVTLRFSESVLNENTDRAEVTLSLEGYETLGGKTIGITGIRVSFAYDTRLFEIVTQADGNLFYSPRGAVVNPNVFFLNEYDGYATFVYGDMSLSANLVKQSGIVVGFTLRPKKGVFIPAGEYPISLYESAGDLEVNRIDSDIFLVPVSNVSVASGKIIVQHTIDRRADEAVVLQIDNKQALVYGQTSSMDVPPMIVEDRTLVPVRFLAEAIGAKVDWDENTRTVTLVTQKQDNISITIDSNVLIVNGKNQTIDVPAKIISNRTMLPIRSITEALCHTVYWDNTKRLIVVAEAMPQIDDAFLEKLAEKIK